MSEYHKQLLKEIKSLAFGGMEGCDQPYFTALDNIYGIADDPQRPYDATMKHLDVSNDLGSRIEKLEAEKDLLRKCWEISACQSEKALTMADGSGDERCWSCEECYKQNPCDWIKESVARTLESHSQEEVL